ncbi:hypothetical protein AB5J62_39180 [Amycolatopsis sp. cg5]|uniref:hypothetical protein n=1 Tax=Amycolatopsis sp. cg5 TaxID=3238802 RepID=UPI0035232BAC
MLRTRVLSRALFTATALALTAATAAPALATTVTSEVRAADESTQAERVAALTALGLFADPESLALPEKDFEFRLWVLSGPQLPETRSAAYNAYYYGTDGDRTAFIRVGVHEKLAVDVQNGSVELQARDARKRAAELIKFVPRLIDVVVDDSEFTFRFWQHATGIDNAEVKAAAAEAHRAGPEACTEFLRAGVYAAHERDIQAAIERAKAEAEARRWREIKVRAGAVVGIPADSTVYNLDDEALVQEIFMRAREGTHVWSAAYRAVLSRDPVVYRQFIETGIHEANARDHA